MMALLAAVACFALSAGSAPAYAATQGGETAASAVRWDLSVGMALSIGISCLAAAYAVGRVGAAALGAASERPELLVRSLVFVALGEGLAVFGFLIALLLWLKF